MSYASLSHFGSLWDWARLPHARLHDAYSDKEDQLLFFKFIQQRVVFYILWLWAV